MMNWDQACWNPFMRLPLSRNLWMQAFKWIVNMKYLWAFIPYVIHIIRKTIRALNNLSGYSLLMFRAIAY